MLTKLFPDTQIDMIWIADQKINSDFIFNIRELAEQIQNETWCKQYIKAVWIGTSRKLRSGC